jgi:hypothetical protein
MRSWSIRATDARRTLRACGISLALAAPGACVPAVAAQGVVTAAIEGLVRGDDGDPIGRAEIEVLDRSTGRRWTVLSNARGRFAAPGLPVGGPYRVEAHAIGFVPAERDGILLALGQRRPLELVLVRAAARLEEIDVVARGGADAARTGPATSVPDSMLRRLPARNGDVLELALESPQAARVPFGISIAGQNPRHNNIQIDGGVAGDLYGFLQSAPGEGMSLLFPQGGGARVIPLDAVAELQVLAAPFDVRYGGFTGGIINAVTRSGTNAWRGGAYGRLQDDWLVGRDSAGAPIADFGIRQFGATLGGPIVRNRLHLFAAAEIQRSTVPYAGPLIGSDTTSGADSAGVGIRYASAIRFQRILRERYGVDPGDFGPVVGRNPATNLFAKLSGQLGPNHWIELSETYQNGSEHGPAVERFPHDVYAFSSRDDLVRFNTLGTRLSWTATRRSGLASELAIAWQRSRSRCDPAAGFTGVRVHADAGTLEAGRGYFCPTFGVAQDAVELSAGLTRGLGAHRLTGGTHAELLHFRDAQLVASEGDWYFESLDSLDAGLASAFTRGARPPSRPEGPLADFGVRQVGLDLQDEWSPSPGLSVTLGVRVDVPFFASRPPENPAVLASFGVSTANVPSGRPLWSPRLGANWALDRARATVLRGGIGLFAGRPAFDIPAAVYKTTGLEQLVVTCTGDDVPAFAADPSLQPASCRATPTATPPVPRVGYLDPAFRFPQALKLALGVDRRLPLGVTGTVDFLLSRAVHAAFYTDVNLLRAGVATGEGGRQLYGALDAATGVATPLRRDPAFDRVIRAMSLGGDRAASLTLQLERRFAGGAALAASWTRAAVRDRMTELGYGILADQVGASPVDGTLELRNLRRSSNEVPNRVRVSGVVSLPLGLTASAIYEGASGLPYASVVDGDANADGYGGALDPAANDLVYVPRDPSDITLARAAEYPALDAYIRAEPCLEAQRGRIMQRNSCRDHWSGRLDLQLAKGFGTTRAQRLEIVADLFNAPNLLNRRWGLVRRSARVGVGQVPLLGLVGWDEARNRGVYELRMPERNQVDVDASRWRMQLGMRYAF